MKLNYAPLTVIILIMCAIRASLIAKQEMCARLLALVQNDPKQLWNYLKSSSISANCFKLGMQVSVKENNLDSLQVFLENNRYLSGEDEVRILMEGFRSHSLEAVVALINAGFMINANGRRQQSLLQRLLWTSEWHWSTADIEHLMVLKSCKCLLGQLDLLLDMPSAEHAILYSKLLLQNGLKTSDSIVWYLVLNKVKTLDDAELSKVFRYLLRNPFCTARAVWLHYQLVKNFVQTYETHMITLSNVIEDPRVVVSGGLAASSHETGSFLAANQAIIAACKKGDAAGFTRCFTGMANSPVILDVLLRCTWSCTPNLEARRVTVNHLLPRVYQIPLAHRPSLQRSFPALDAVWTLTRRATTILLLDDIQPDDVKQLIVNLLAQLAEGDITNGLLPMIEF